MSQEQEVSQDARPAARPYRDAWTETTPHRQAMGWHERAVEALRAAEMRAAEMVSDAEREVGESLAEVARYEKQPGVALPVADQYRIQDLMAAARRRMDERRMQELTAKRQRMPEYPGEGR